ncbi:hypothetical protein PIROE2DRAFT_3241 [Piromyces sp. E2]|nr:hypothetical protein PIROE2DRAFT_3241 [Piromyces sp. E2]|eukprot:OUM69002.1 hypothetical protein PIROE2DRAFT_3241 [Piromyces sp. E2]
MSIINEEELIELKIFLEYNINAKQFKKFKNVLLYLIKENFPFDIIKFIIEQQKEQSINKTELLFYSIEFNNFGLATILINCETRVDNKNTDSKNIIEYLIEKRNLDSRKFLFIMKHIKNASLITPEVLCQLIKLE